MTQDIEIIEVRPIDSLRPHPLNSQLYAPNGGPEFDELKASMAEHGLLARLMILSDGTIISGHRRWEAARSLGWTEIECEVSPLDPALDALLIEERIIEFNRYRRKTFTEIMQEAKRLEDIYSIKSAMRRGKRTDLGNVIPPEEQGDTRERVSNAIGVAERTYDKMKKVYAAAATNPMIAEKVKSLDQGTTSLENVFKLTVQLAKPASDFEPKVYDIWYFGGLNPKYGKPHPGSLPGDYVENVVHYWTEEGQVVADPFSGGGITIDVCKNMKRVCYASDLVPTRPDIFQWDMTNGYPPYEHAPNLIFLDPPYWNMVAEDYDEASVSGFGFIEFLQFLKKLSHDTAKALAPGGVVAAVIMKQKFRLPEGLPFMDWPFTWYTFFRETGMVPVDRIILPWPTSIWQPFHVTKAKDDRRILPLAGDMIVMMKPAEGEQS